MPRRATLNSPTNVKISGTARSLLHIKPGCLLKLPQNLGGVNRAFTIGGMSGAPDEARGARRLLIVVLLAAGCGGLLAGVLAVVQDRPGRALPTAAPRVFSESFRQPGFLSGQVGLTD